MRSPAGPLEPRLVSNEVMRRKRAMRGVYWRVFILRFSSMEVWSGRCERTNRVLLRASRSIGLPHGATVGRPRSDYLSSWTSVASAIPSIAPSCRLNDRTQQHDRFCAWPERSCVGRRCSSTSRQPASTACCAACAPAYVQFDRRGQPRSLIPHSQRIADTRRAFSTRSS